MLSFGSDLKRILRRFHLVLMLADLARVRVLRDHQAVIEDLLEIGRIHGDDGQLNKAEQRTQQARQKAVALRNEFVIAHADFQLGCVFKERKDYAQARAAFEAALPALRRRGRPEQVFDTLLNLGVVSDELGRADEAAVFWREAAAIAKAGEDGRRLALASFNLGSIAFRQRRYEEAARYWNEATQLARRARDIEKVAKASFFLGVASRNLGQLDRARELIGESGSLYRRLGRTELAARATAYLLDLESYPGAPHHQPNSDQPVDSND
jgi:tetratricopeptide (TPR) repeat protein